MTFHWSAAYVGLPWREGGRFRTGIDCWGLVRLAYFECGRVDLPSYDDVYTADKRVTVAGVMGQSLGGAGPWREVAMGSERDTDLLIFSRGGLDMHAGIAVGGGMMLHIDGDTSRVECYSRGRWSFRWSGAYRHEALSGDECANRWRALTTPR